MPWPSLVVVGARPGAGAETLAGHVVEATTRQGVRVAAVTMEDAADVQLETRDFPAASTAKRLVDAGAVEGVRVRGPAGQRARTLEAVTELELHADVVVLVGAPILAVAMPRLAVLVTGHSPRSAWDAVARGVADRAELHVTAGSPNLAQALAAWLAGGS